MIYKKIWATIRHDIWKELEDQKKSLRKDKLSKEEIYATSDGIHDKFESIRQEIYIKIIDDDVTAVQARRNMQRCYIQNATISSMSRKEGSDAKRSRWPEQVRQVAREHNKLCTDILNGKYYQNIDKDPRETNTADEKIDLKTLGKFRKTFATQQTMLPGDNIRVKTASKGVDKYCDKMLAWLQRVRKRIAERKVADGENAKFPKNRFNSSLASYLNHS